MHFDPKFQVELCVSKDPTRTHLVAVHFDKEKQKLVATDGHMIAVVPCLSEPSDVGGSVVPAAIREARRASVAATRGRSNRIRILAKKEEPRGPQIKASKDMLDTGSILYRRTDNGTFPPWEQVLPKFKPGDAGTVTFGVNPNLLVSVMKAIGVGTRSPYIHVTVKIPDDDSEMLEPILITREETDGAVAVVMPARTSVRYKPAKK